MMCTTQRTPEDFEKFYESYMLLWVEAKQHGIIAGTANSFQVEYDGFNRKILESDLWKFLQGQQVLVRPYEFQAPSLPVTARWIP